MRILILEDHPSIYCVIEMIVKEVLPNVEIDYFSEWDKALESIRKSSPDFVITDIQIGEYKQLDIPKECHLKKIPFMVFTSHINTTILDHCDQLKARVVVAKSSPIDQVKLGVTALLQDRYFRCEISQNISNLKSRFSETTPKVIFSAAEEFVILAQIDGKSTLQLSEESGKSKFTIRNQRMKLMEKNHCTMEEIVRRYLFWHTKG